MRLHAALFIALAAAGIAEAHATQAVCSQSSGEKTLSQLNADYIELRSGSASHAVPIADIQSIDVTGPVNRINRVAWATLNMRHGQAQKVGIALPDAGTLVLDGVGPQGAHDSIDLLDCNRIAFKTGS